MEWRIKLAVSVGREEKSLPRIYSLPVHTVVSGGGGLMPSPTDKGESLIPLAFCIGH